MQQLAALIVVALLHQADKSLRNTADITRCRLNNPPHTELLAAAKEQMKITELRLQKIVSRQAAQTKAQDQTAELADRRAGLVLNHLMGALPFLLCTRGEAVLKIN